MTRTPYHLAVRRSATLVAALALSSGLAACADNPEPESGPGPAAPTASDATASTSTPSAAADPPPPDGKPFGPGCDRYLPRSGPDLDVVADIPTLEWVLVQDSLRDSFGKMLQVGLAETRDVTYFVPTNKAVNALPLDVRGEIVTDDRRARRFFGHHIVTERLAPSALSGEHSTVARDTLTITVSGEDVGVGLQGADVVCGNIETRDATVYIVDQALES
ncbi:MAG: fasciclin domain-containing protein [Nocardioides sp.]